MWILCPRYDYRNEFVRTGKNWPGWISWIALDWIGLDGTWWDLVWIVVFDRNCLDWMWWGLTWLNWIGSDWIGMKCIGPHRDWLDCVVTPWMLWQLRFAMDPTRMLGALHKYKNKESHRVWLVPQIRTTENTLCAFLSRLLLSCSTHEYIAKQCTSHPRRYRKKRVNHSLSKFFHLPTVTLRLPGVSA